jgi:hypothetical protein
LKETGNDLLQNDWCRCAEVAAQGYRVALTGYGGRVLFSRYSDNCRGVNLWLAAARKL